MHGFRSTIVLALVAAGLLAGCARAGTAPMAGSRWESGPTVPAAPQPKPKPRHTKHTPAEHRQTEPEATQPEATDPKPTKPGW
jgi:hypothetical protein